MMSSRWPQRLAWLGGCLGLLLAVLVFAPARWLAEALHSASEGQVQLVNAGGSVWRGQADLLLTGGEGSRSLSALPQGLRWRLAPTWASGQPAVAVKLSTPCCSPEPLDILLLPGWQGKELRLAAFSSEWPAVLLAGLGTPWNTLRPDGQLALRSSGLSVRQVQGRVNLQGGLTVDALDMASRLSTLRPLGSYRLELQAAEDGHNATLNLSTLRGGLQLQGSGQWVGGRLRFQGEAQAAPGRESALDNLLNILGRRQGPRSILNIG
jgi:general secretion pathway protein N